MLDYASEPLVIEPQNYNNASAETKRPLHDIPAWSLVFEDGWMENEVASDRSLKCELNQAKALECIGEKKQGFCLLNRSSFGKKKVIIMQKWNGEYPGASSFPGL